MGSLPAILGLVVLFDRLQPRQRHASSRRSTWPTWSPRPAPICVLAMGLVLVLLLGEIDLSAGVAGGAGATITAPAASIDHGWTLVGRRARRPGRRRGDRPGHRPAGGLPRHPVVRGHPGVLPRPAGRAAEAHRPGRLGPLQRRGAARAGDQERARSPSAGSARRCIVRRLRRLLSLWRYRSRSRQGPGQHPPLSLVAHPDRGPRRRSCSA